MYDEWGYVEGGFGPHWSDPHNSMDDPYDHILGVSASHLRRVEGFTRKAKLQRIDQSQHTGEKADMKGQLYQVKGTEDQFGTLLATNSEGQLVLEMRGAGGEVRAFNREDVKEVLPYSYGVRFGGVGKTYQYIGTEGEVEVGDILIPESGGLNNLATVVSVNTRSRNATKRFAGRKLLTQALKAD